MNFSFIYLQDFNFKKNHLMKIFRFCFKMKKNELNYYYLNLIV